jgi:Fe-S cluster biogenesis protein NfuA
MLDTVTISAQITPNPNTLKFVVDKVIMPAGSVDFSNPEKAENSPLPKALFALEGVVGVMVGVNFVSVSKGYEVDWAALAEPITKTLHTYLDTEQTILDASFFNQSSETRGDDIESRIKHILDTEIRPAVAMDGGDITFYGYEDGVVSLHLQGACSTCPSSTLTLKMGIENRLREEFPEIVEVVQV